MLILALETATGRGSLATCIDGRCQGRSGDSARTHGERLPGEVLAWLADGGRAVSDVDLFAVVTGPGSFTGLRVGIAAVQGFALAGRRKVVGVPTLDAMIGAVFGDRRLAGAVVVPCLDGQRGEVFAAAFETTGAGRPDACVPLVEPVSATPAELVDLVAGWAGERRIVLVCHEVDRYLDTFRAAWPAADFIPLPVTLAESAARLADARPERAVAPHALRPLYVRRPDAVVARERAGRGRPAGFVIRRATSRDDLAAVDALQRQTFTNPWGAESIRWELENTDVSRLYLMHDASGALVAYCACWMVFDELHINSLAVDRSHRRTGIATMLLDRVLADAAASGARAATLEVRRSNTAARALYERLGFVVEGLRRDYYQDPREDAIILWKRHLSGQRAEGRGQREGTKGSGQRGDMR
jgi:tRNA threonylcarbamoyl adenosine modification protein YeaZ/ribosomal-protein-alanine acetyltransferase